GGGAARVVVECVEPPAPTPKGRRTGCCIVPQLRLLHGGPEGSEGPPCRGVFLRLQQVSQVPWHSPLRRGYVCAPLREPTAIRAVRLGNLAGRSHGGGCEVPVEVLVPSALPDSIQPVLEGRSACGMEGRTYPRRF